jgi:peptide/nickel transport system substrate-binding protein
MTIHSSRQRRALCAVTCALVIGLVLAGCAAPATPTPTAKPKPATATPVPPTPVPPTPVPKVLNFGPLFDAKGLSPDMDNFWTKLGCVENLTYLDSDGSLIPALATEWTITGDKSWEFTLREGVTFHNGQPFNAEAAVFALNRYFGLDSARSELKGATASATGDYLIQITTAQHIPYLPQLFTDYTTGIMHADAFNADGEATTVIGTGPFKMIEWVKDEYATLHKFADYWGGEPHIDIINLLRIPDLHTRATMVKTGELDIARGIALTDAKAMMNDPNIVIMVTPQTRYRVIYFNNSAPPFDDVRVRKAINYAIDREALVEYVLEGYGSVAQGVFLPTLPWGNPDLKGYNYDPDAAKALLKEAGQEDLTFTLCSYTSRPSLPLIAQAVQAQLAEIGVTVELEVGEYSACQKAVSDLTHEAVLIARGPLYGGYDPTTLYASDYASDGGYNWSIYRNPEFDALLSQAQATDDPDTRYTLSQELEKLVVDEAVDVFLSYYVGIDAVRANVTGFTPHRLEMGSPMHLLDIE